MVNFVPVANSGYLQTSQAHLQIGEADLVFHCCLAWNL